MCRCSDPGIRELKAVLGVLAHWLGSKSCLVEGSVQEVTGTISSKHTSSTISTMCSRRQTKNHQPRRDVTERRNRFTPVVPVEVCPAFRNRDFPRVVNQTRAALTFHYLPIQRDKVSGVSFTGFW